MKKLSEIFPKYIFWDCDLNNFSLDDQEDRSFIIQRVLKMSFIEENLLEKIEDLFPTEEIKYYAAGSKEIFGNERIEMLCKRYNMKLKQFPQYIENINKLMSK